MRVPRFSVYQVGRGSEPGIVVGSMMSLVARYIFAISQNAERDFQFLTGRWYSLLVQREQQKVATAAAPAHRTRSVALGRRPDGRWTAPAASRQRTKPASGLFNRAPSCKALRHRIQC